MNKIILLSGLILTLSGFATVELMPTPEKIYSFTRVAKSYDYYLEQGELWQKETEKTPANADAWLNYFQAARYANMFAKGEKPFDLDALVSQLPDAIPNTAEFHYITFIYKGRGPDNFEHIQKAYELAPDHPSICHDIIALKVTKGETEEVRNLCEKWYKSGEMSSGLLKWNYNMLMSVEDNGILITWGDNDTYPSWILQNVKNVRPDIMVVNAYMLTGYEEYRNRIFEKNDIPALEKSPEDFEDHASLFKYVTLHALLNSKRPIYLSPPMPADIRNAQSENFYLTGMAFKYSREEFDNVAMMKNNYENKFLKDYLLIDLENDISEEVVNNLNVNYIPAFLKLYRHYEESGEILKANQVKTLLKRTAEKGGKLDDIRTYIGEKKASDKKIDSDLEIKTLDRGFVKIKGNLYAWKTELTNENYENFLMDLLKNRAFEKLNIAKTGKTNWRSFLPEKYKNLTDEIIYQHGHPEAPETPVQNIAHEAAKMYCEWVTEVYNNSDHKKKLYKKVIFRLPTEEEWVQAARGGHMMAPYPWGGYYYKNAVGCYLSNFDVTTEEPCKDCKLQVLSNDGGFFTVKADSYFPNDYGCYNMSGNVAEMIQTPGVAMGGSWADNPEVCKVDSKQEFERPSPKVGFRVFMEVLEHKE